MSDVSTGGHELSLVFVVGDDLGELLLDKGRVLGLTTDSTESMGGLVDLSSLDEPSRGFWEEEETNSEDQSREIVSTSTSA